MNVTGGTSADFLTGVLNSDTIAQCRIQNAFAILGFNHRPFWAEFMVWQKNNLWHFYNLVWLTWPCLNFVYFTTGYRFANACIHTACRKLGTGLIDLFDDRFNGISGITLARLA